MTKNSTIPSCSHAHLYGGGCPPCKQHPFALTLPVGTVTPNKHAVLTRQTSACLRKTVEGTAATPF